MHYRSACVDDMPSSYCGGVTTNCKDELMRSVCKKTCGHCRDNCDCGGKNCEIYNKSINN